MTSFFSPIRKTCGGEPLARWLPLNARLRAVAVLWSLWTGSGCFGAGTVSESDAEQAGEIGEQNAAAEGQADAGGQAEASHDGAIRTVDVVRPDDGAASDGADAGQGLEVHADAGEHAASPQDAAVQIAPTVPDAGHGQPQVGSGLEPLAEGYGAQATGGEGGRVMTVTTLADSGPGSLRAAIDASGPRIVRFAVAGVIRFAAGYSNGPIVRQGDITIDGSTAPPPGITLTGNWFRVDAPNVVLRYLRFRHQPANYDALVFLGGTDGALIDHCSIAWSGDDSLGSDGDNPQNITVQWSLIAEPLDCNVNPEKSCGRNLWAPRTGLSRVSFHHNLWANAQKGIPPGGGRAAPLEFFNNIVSFYREVPTLAGQLDVVGNVFMPAAAEQAARWSSGFHHRDNVLLVPSSLARRDPFGEAPQAERVGTNTYRLFSASDGELEEILASDVGATLPCRDETDARLVRDMLKPAQGQTVATPPEGVEARCVAGQQ